MLIWSGESNGAVRVDGWPDSPRVYSTIAMYTHDFDGVILIEGSIENDPTDDDWFEVTAETFIKPLRDRSNIQNRIHNFQGRVLWMRAIVTNNHGRVDRVLVL